MSALVNLRRLPAILNYAMTGLLGFRTLEHGLHRRRWELAHYQRENEHEYRACRPNRISPHEALEQREADRSEATAPAETCLGHPNTTPNRWTPRDLALFNLAIDSKLRSCDIVNIKVEEVAPHGYTVDKKAEGRITVAYDVAGTNWKLSVSDNGIGKPDGVFA
jgi:hypothetical protein